MHWTNAVRKLGSGRAPFVRLPPSASIHPFGSPAKVDRSKALLRFPDSGWLINNDGREGWAIVGDGEGRKLAVETLLGRHRILPLSPPPGPLPVNSLSVPPEAPNADEWKPVRYLAFARPSSTGEFTDFTARYGALQEEDKLTLREQLEARYPVSDESLHQVIHTAVDLMGLRRLLDIPAISLSSGQTRRARIAQALMAQPAVLLLEDPMAGLDVGSREIVTKLLGDTNAAEAKPRVILVLRDKGGHELPSWITNVCEVRNGNVRISSREEWDARKRTEAEAESEAAERIEEIAEENDEGTSAAPVVQLSDVSVSYGEGTRQVLNKVNWTIRPGEHWHLQGANGSGKTTLLSLILGHHPQSFSLPATSLTLFSKPRRLVPTPILRSLIGHTSPEIYAAFPRSMGLDALDAVGSGFEGVFSRRGLSASQRDRVLYLLEFFRPLLSSSRTGAATADATVKDIARRPFGHFTPAQQALLLFLRAVAGRAPLLVLDEAAQGMDEAIWARCRELLDEEWREIKQQGGQQQAVIVISHYEDEVPWTRGKVLRLEDGVATVVQ